MMENSVVMTMLVGVLMLSSARAGRLGRAGSRAKRRWKNPCSALSQPRVSSRFEHRTGGFPGARPGHDTEQALGPELADSNSRVTTAQCRRPEKASSFNLVQNL
jgi:hypothetical protein